jgi:hypothetical protein
VISGASGLTRRVVFDGRDITGQPAHAIHAWG